MMKYYEVDDLSKSLETCMALNTWLLPPGRWDLTKIGSSVLLGVADQNLGFMSATQVTWKT